MCVLCAQRSRLTVLHGNQTIIFYNEFYLRADRKLVKDRDEVPQRGILSGSTLLRVKDLH